jgi:hypothetical protein
MKVIKELKEPMVFKELRVFPVNTLAKDTRDFKDLKDIKVIRVLRDLHRLYLLF